MSQDMEKQTGKEFNDPPAKNLRKNSARNISVDTNMAEVSNKTNKVEKCAKTPKPKQEKEKKRGKRNMSDPGTPSVKGWLQTPISASVNNLHDDEETIVKETSQMAVKDSTVASYFNAEQAKEFEFNDNTNVLITRFGVRREVNRKPTAITPIDDEIQRIVWADQTANYNGIVQQEYLKDNDESIVDQSERRNSIDDMAVTELKETRLETETVDSEEDTEIYETGSEDESKIQDKTIIAKPSEDKPEPGQPKGMMEILTTMYEEMKGIRDDFNNERKANKVRIDNVELEQKKQQVVMSKFKKDLEEQKERIKLLTGVVIKQDRLIRSLSKDATANEIRRNKQNVIIGNIDEVDGPEDCEATAQNFFKNGMGIDKDIKIKRAYRLGRKNADKKRRLLVRLCHVNQKGTLFKAFPRLKGKKNSDGESYYIKDHLPDYEDQQKRRKSNKVKFNKQLIDAQQQEMEWKKGELWIDGVEYQPKVVEPMADKILQMSSGDIQKMLSAKVYEGDIMTKKDSTFMGFAVNTNSTKEVQIAYAQLKYRFPEATHIMCGYLIEGEDAAHLQDAVDGGEGRGGLAILEMLCNEDMKNCAAFVVRHHDGPNIGPIRFSMIADAAKSAAETLPAFPQDAQYSMFKAPINSRAAGVQARARGGSVAARNLFPSGRNESSVNKQTKAATITSIAV